MDKEIKVSDLRKHLLNYELESISMASRSTAIMKDVCGFTIARKKTKDKGTGVYVSDGFVPPGKIVALYPGII